MDRGGRADGDADDRDEQLPPGERRRGPGPDHAGRSSNGRSAIAKSPEPSRRGRAGQAAIARGDCPAPADPLNSGRAATVTVAAEDRIDPQQRRNGRRAGSVAVRVLMTGGYGCIGSWVAKRLIDERRRGLDLRPPRGHPPARPAARRRGTRPGPLRRRRRGRPRRASARRPIGSRSPTCSTWRRCRSRSAGPTRSGARRSTSSARSRPSRRPGPRAGGSSGSSTPARRPSTGRSRPAAAVADRRRGPPGAGDALRGLQGLQRAERPGLLARPRDHQRRAPPLDRLRGRPRLRHDQRADEGDQGRRRRPAVPDQLRRAPGPPVRRRRRRRLPRAR